MSGKESITKKPALVIFSGGQDSTTCLFWAKKNFARVEAITFSYGQRHKVELEAASKICELVGCPQKVLPLSGFRELGGNALTGELPVGGEGLLGLPNTFVPGRNLIFLTYAAAYGYQRGIRDLVTGVCETDYSGYPDCRADSLSALERALQLGMEYPIKIHTPLMNLTKRETVELAAELGALDALAYSHTCYNGTFPPCAKCPACELRQKGFHEAGIADPIFSRPM